MRRNMQYKLLTPGPLTTTDTVKQEMMVDHCTWDDDYKQVTQKIRSGLLELAGVSPEEYTTVLMQGSGTFGVEAAITTLREECGRRSARRSPCGNRQTHGRSA